MKEIDPMLLARQIDAYCAANGISKQDFTEQTGISTATLSQWRNGIYSPGPKKIAALEAFTNMPIEALLFGHPASISLVEDQKAKKAPTTAGERNISCFLSRFSALDAHGKDAVFAVMECEEKRMAEENQTDTADVVSITPMIRHYFSSPAAGVGGMEAGEDYEDIPLPADAPQNADYCLTVSGDSMEPYIPEGSMVYVMRDAPLSDFDVGIFIVDGIAYVKQYCRGYGGDIYLLSANPKREDANITIYASGDQRIDCRGKVIVKKKLPKPVYG